VNIDLSVPIWTIEHVAAALQLSVDTAREYTYRTDFPHPRAGFSRDLWTRRRSWTGSPGWRPSRAEPAPAWPADRDALVILTVGTRASCRPTPDGEPFSSVPFPEGSWPSRHRSQEEARRDRCR
jgi:hypothetical protein